MRGQNTTNHENKPVYYPFELSKKKKGLFRQFLSSRRKDRRVLNENMERNTIKNIYLGKWQLNKRIIFAKWKLAKNAEIHRQQHTANGMRPHLQLFRGEASFLSKPVSCYPKAENVRDSARLMGRFQSISPPLSNSLFVTDGNISKLDHSKT